MKIGCESCHKQTLTTGYSAIDGLSYQTIHPFTDLLVHDMGPGLDDGYTEGNAKTSEWRTTPLWGLGLAPGVQGGTYYLLHDGRAHSIQQAIQMHGGEARLAQKGLPIFHHRTRLQLSNSLSRYNLWKRTEFLKTCGFACLSGTVLCRCFGGLRQQ